MDYLGIEELPKRHILKRWTRDARDILPDHLRVYQIDQGRTKSFTYCHSRIYKKALELVRLGDASVEAYERLEGLFDNDLAIMALTMKKEMDWGWRIGRLLILVPIRLRFLWPTMEVDMVSS
jgi:hypothetical protein